MALDAADGFSLGFALADASGDPSQAQIFRRVSKGNGLIGRLTHMRRRIDLSSRVDEATVASAPMDPIMARAVIQRREQQLQRWVSRSPEHPASGTERLQGRLTDARSRQEAEAAVTDWPPQSGDWPESTSVPADLIVEQQEQSALDRRVDGVVGAATSIGHTHRASGILGIGHVSLAISNLDRSAAWYASTLGFEELFREESDDRKACVMTFPGDGYSVGLVQHTRNGKDEFDPQRRGLDHVAFTVGSREAFEQWATDLTAAGVDHSGVVEVPPGAILNFKDPDGIALALFWNPS